VLRQASGVGRRQPPHKHLQRPARALEPQPRPKHTQKAFRSCHCCVSPAAPAVAAASSYARP
jgi:hypothetical protein